MGSVTCERCGFVSFATSEVCKQCGGPLPGPAAAFNWRPPQPQPNWQHQQQGAHDWEQQQAHANNWPPPPPHDNSYQSHSGYYAADEGLPKRKGTAVVAMLCGLLSLPVVILGALAAIPLGAPAAILGGLIGLVMMILALVLGIVGIVRVNKNPAEFGGKGMAVAGVVLGGLLVCSVVPIGIISAIAIPNLLASRKAANESATIGALRKISSAQATYQSTAGGGSYGTMDELVENQLLEMNMAESTYCGYRYELTVSGDSYEVSATPVSPSMGTRSFFTNETGVIRGADKRGEAADEDDPPVGEGSFAGSPAGEDVEWTENGPVIRRTNSSGRR